MLFSYIGIDYENDPNFFGYDRNQQGIGYIFGKKHEILYHEYMSLEMTLKLYNKIAINYKRQDYNPFDEEHRLPFYDYIVFYTMITRMKKDLIGKIYDRFKGKPFSDVDLLSDWQNCPKEIFDSLEDVRSCTFTSEFRIEKTLSCEVNFKKLVNADGYALTPNFLQHFDFNDLYDFECVRFRVNFAAMMIGFSFASTDVTGDKI